MDGSPVPVSRRVNVTALTSRWPLYLWHYKVTRTSGTCINLSFVPRAIPASVQNSCPTVRVRREPLIRVSRAARPECGKP